MDSESENWQLIKKQCQNEGSLPVRIMTPADLAQNIQYRFVDGGEGEMKAEEMLSHALHHSKYHRGAIGWLVSERGITPPQRCVNRVPLGTY